MPPPLSSIKFAGPILIILWVLLYLWMLFMDPVSRLVGALIAVVIGTLAGMALPAIELTIDLGSLAGRFGIPGVSGTYSLHEGPAAWQVLIGGLLLSLVLLAGLRLARSAP